ncbi:MAG: RecQ family ATP-dependent DNA helicase [Treponema sp.]|jgi:ATP-dependent DNA helicase RecQ|nr:RecQ family ATP-dependent DNA helicase [Treponema sp.]
MENIKNSDAAPDPLSAAVKELFGLSYLFPYQRLVITNILESAEAAGVPITWPHMETCERELSDRECLGRQIVILPTGAGKSLCFQLPAMLMEGLTMVIYPILSLMADQQRRLQERGFSPVILRGGQSAQEREAIWEKLKTGQCKFIIANPEVLLIERVKEHFKKIKVNHLVIDEAHCVSEWGESFRPGYLEINTIIKLINPPLVTAFTATASAPVLEKIRKYIFGELEARQVVGNPDRANICYAAQGCFNRDLAVRDLLIKNLRPAIVFCSSRSGTEKIARYLRLEFAEMGMIWRNEIRFYHAGLSREEKTQTEKWFMTNTEAVLCATCAYGMGVDKADVRTVIHRDCAPSVEAYLQEAGRAGRDGEQSHAILLWGPDDDTSLARAGGNENRNRIQQLLSYARDTDHCRRHSLLTLLNYDSSGEVPEYNCCDICEKRPSKKLREEDTIIRFFRKNKRRFTCDEAASVLSNAKTIRWSSDEASHVITMLIKSGKLKKINNFLFKNKITT